MLTNFRHSMPGAQAVRALVDHSLIHKQQISADLQQRLLCWVFGMTVSGHHQFISSYTTVPWMFGPL
jgi:hypothetical protein